jgi:hypothetical protein
MTENKVINLMAHKRKKEAEEEARLTADIIAHSKALNWEGTSQEYLDCFKIFAPPRGDKGTQHDE